MSAKDERIETLESAFRTLDDRFAEAQLELVGCRARERVLVALVIRAAREMNEPILRASLLEDLETEVPGALRDLPESLQPKSIRRRVRS